MRPQIRRSNTKAQHKVGLQFLGANFRQSFDFYQSMADRYWQMSMQDKRCLGAAKKCYVIALENAMQIMKLFSDETNETRMFMQGKVQ